MDGPPQTPRRAAIAALVLFGPALVWLLAAGLGLAWTARSPAAWVEIDRHGDASVGSDSCRSCHGEQWTSWHHSWHRTMTQRVGALPDGLAPATAVVEPLAPFAGEQLDYLGFRATMDRSGEGRPRITVHRLDDDGEPTGAAVFAAEVALSVGSHRYQQYVAVLDREQLGELWRLPLAWHRAEQRWIHLNGAFVEPEGEAGSLADYERHLSRWNDNCLFCHNTEPSPGLRPGGEGRPPRFASVVGELGIACEACHGPGEAHLARHRNPLRRILARGRGDGSIAHPGRMDPARESEVCGRCHGQRIALDIASVLAGGDGFVPGDRLASVSRPIEADSTIAGVEGLDRGRPFAARFWPDGTPRLSAYEYQGLLASPCHAPRGDRPALGCNHCHDMHGEERDGQVRAGRAGAGACVDCHAPRELGGAATPGGHGGHGQLAPDVDCLDCHMPRITYGLLEGMISHRISSPDPAALIGRDDQPDACTQCHVDRSRSWAAAAMAELGLRGSVVEGRRPAAHEGAAPRVVLDLLGGDPLQRNLAAHALARPKATGSLEARMAWIADGLEDEYPSVRWFAWRGLRELAAELPAGAPRRAELLAALDAFDYLAPIEVRAVTIQAIRDRLAAPALADRPQLREALLERRVALSLWIGE